MNSSRARRAAALADRMPEAPADVLARMQAYLRVQDFPMRGMPAALQDFYARLHAAGLPPDLVTEEIFDAVATSRSRLRALLRGLRMFAPDVPLALAAPVTRRWDAWLNARYNRKPRKMAHSCRVGLAPEDWPDAWFAALPALDRTVRPYREPLRRLAPKTREVVVSAVGLLAAARIWAAERDVAIGTVPSADLLEAFLHYILIERKVSFRTAANYFERLRMFFLRAGLFEKNGFASISDLIGALSEEATDRDPGKWRKLREFRKTFSLADLLHKAVAAEKKAAERPAHTAAALRLRQKAVAYALLVNTADRQGDLREFRIGIDITRKPDGLWLHAIRQSKTHRAKELGPLWPGTSRLIDVHLLADRPAWMIAQRARDLEGANLLTLGDQVVHKGFINSRLHEDFKIHGHLVRTLLTDLVRRERPDARWAAQHMLGHTDRNMQETYRSDFAESGAIRAMDRCIAEVAEAGQGAELSGRHGKKHGTRVP